MSRLYRHIPVHLIDMDRWPMDRRVLALTAHLESGGAVPPIHVQPGAGGRYMILDGRHRTLAHRLLGRPTILAKYGVIGFKG